MKHILTYLFFALMPTILMAQSDPVLIIDGITTTFKSGLSFPYWLKAGQTINLGTNVKSISVLEFTIDNENLKFSQVLSITNLQTVPAGKAWKMESLGFGSNGQSIGGFSTGTAPSIFTSPKVFNIPDTYEWIVPPGVTNICVEVWGAGGAYLSASGLCGGGGSYGYECIAVVPGTVYTIIVGNGGLSGATSILQNGGSSSFGNLISANGGMGGINGGTGGVSTAEYNIPGGNSTPSYGGASGNTVVGEPGRGGPFGGGYEGAPGRINIYW